MTSAGAGHGRPTPVIHQRSEPRRCRKAGPRTGVRNPRSLTLAARYMHRGPTASLLGHAVLQESVKTRNCTPQRGGILMRRIPSAFVSVVVAVALVFVTVAACGGGGGKPSYPAATTATSTSAAVPVPASSPGAVPAPPSTSAAVPVPASQWTDTKLDVATRDVLGITASGSWTDGHTTSGPSGAANPWPDNFFNLADLGACMYCVRTLCNKPVGRTDRLHRLFTACTWKLHVKYGAPESVEGLLRR